jgi:prepilin-type N-terminal cleavage/methylation domain-containing protein
MKKKAFTLVEIIAVIVILAIILAIAVPAITGIIRNSSRTAFESDAKLLLTAINYKKLDNEAYIPSNVSLANIGKDLGLSSDNYKAISVEEENNQVVIKLVGQNKWDGFSACGTVKSMKVYDDNNCGGTVDIIPPVIKILGDNPLSIYVNDSYTEPGFEAYDGEVNLTSSVIVNSDITPNVPGTYTAKYTVSDALGNVTIEERKIIVIDNQDPEITFVTNGTYEYVKSSSTRLNIIDSGGVEASSLKYVWSTSTEQPSLDLFATSFGNGDIIDTPTDVSGKYYLWVTAKDKAGNETTIRSDDFKLDNIKPIINISGNSSISVNKDSTYIDAGATATDNTDTSVVVNAISNVNTNVIGTYTVTYSAIDSAGNVADEIIRTVQVIDVLAPVITINGSNPVSIYVGTSYTDAGATATDDVDGDITNRITTTSTLNPNAIGTYTVTYSVKDTANNLATATRIVNVIDNIAPTVLFGTNGNSIWAKAYSTTVTVSDAHSGVNVNTLKYQWSISTTTPAEASYSSTFTNGGTINTPAGVTGNYYLWILAKDNAGNITNIKSNVFNLDNTLPVITLNGSGNITIDKGTSYTESGATATDAHSGINGSVSISGSVNTGVAGTYTITYNVSDKAGNAAATVSRTVNVREVQVLTTTTVTFNESTNQSASQTVALTGLVSIQSVTVNTGSVSYSLSGQNITLNVSGGAYTRYESVPSQEYSCWQATCCYTSCWSCTQSYTGTCCGCPGDWPTNQSCCGNPCSSCGYSTVYHTYYYYAYTVTITYYKLV